jgi:glycosyltransferase involved in cell wall biosynthesis
VAVNLSVVILAFNEEESLEAVVHEINSVLQTLGREYEVMIVNDGSTDDTGVIADRLARQNPWIRVIHHQTNRGLGEAYRTGFASAQGELITFFAADGEIPAATIKEFTSLMDKADMVLGYLPRRNASLLAKSLSKAERMLLWLLFGSFPKFQGVFMVRRELLNELELKSKGRGWTVVMELIIRASRGGYKIVSAPTEMRPRMSGKSKVKNLPTILDNLRQVFALRLYLGKRQPGFSGLRAERNGYIRFRRYLIRIDRSFRHLRQ